MSPFNLVGGVSVAICGGLSICALLLTRPGSRRIQLTNDPPEELDPFDLSEKEDLVDGYPVNEIGFWNAMRVRKAIMTALILGVLICQFFAVGMLMDDSISTPLLLHIGFAVYIFFLLSSSILQNSPDWHSRSIVHLSILILGATCISGTLLVIPKSEPPLFSSVVCVFYLLAAAIALTTPRGPSLHFPKPGYATCGEENVAGNANGSIASTWFFLFTTNILTLGARPSFELADLPVLKASMRASKNYTDIRRSTRNVFLRIGSWRPPTGSGLQLAYNLLRVNATTVLAAHILSFVIAFAYYAPPFFLQKLLQYLEVDAARRNTSWGWVWVAGLFLAHFILALVMAQMNFIGEVLATRMRMQLNALLFAKTLVRKDVASSSNDDSATADEEGESSNDGGDYSKAGIIALMSSDVDQVGTLANGIYDITDTPIEILVGVFFLYRLLGISCFVGLAVTLICLPLHQRSGKIVADTQGKLVRARDARVSLTNEILGAIRMLKFMAWERNFEGRVLQIRERELAYQKLSYTVLWTAMGNSVLIIFALVSFWHFTVIRKQVLSPSIAFTAVRLIIFTELQYSIKGIPLSIINLIQGYVSLRRIENYLDGAEVSPVPPLKNQSKTVAFYSATVAWPKAPSGAVSVAGTPHQKFMLLDLSLTFPAGELSLVCGKFGSGKSLLLLGLLGEADVLSGQVLCPRSPPNSLASLAMENPGPGEWILEGLCAYVPQTSWLRNQSIKDNILFNLPYDDERYRKTLHACALVADLNILEDGDESEIGKCERGVNLSGGQKARVSLARAVYSRASILLLDDVLSAVDAHTAHHIYHECLTGPLMVGRTVILVSHHVQLCVAGAAYVVVLDNGNVQFQGDTNVFKKSGIFSNLVQVVDVNNSTADNHDTANPDADHPPAILDAVDDTHAEVKKAPRKFVEDEGRAVGHIGSDIWFTYMHAWGGYSYWAILALILLVAACSPLLENGWLKIWSSSADIQEPTKGPVFYISIYAALTVVGLIVKTLRWYILYSGSIQASRLLFQNLLHSILFANIRFHDTISRGRLLNRFGKDFEAIDKRVATTIGYGVIAFISATITFTVISVVGGLPFCVVAIVLGLIHYRYGKMYTNASRDMRRLASVSSSPLHSMYWEAVSGITTLRAFGGSTQFLLDMIQLLDVNTAPAYWTSAMSQWLGVRSNALTSAVVGVVGIMAVLSPRVDASLTGFAMMFAASATNDFQNMAGRYSRLEQDMVALERIKEYSEIQPEPAEFTELQPPAGWPTQGNIHCQDLVVQYTPQLPAVLHGLSFDISPGEKIGIIGRTGSGKSTLALSLFRFVPVTAGRILIDGIDIAKLGLTDLRRNLTIIPQDPTILSGTLRSTLDVFGEYTDAEIFDALRRVHLIPSSDNADQPADSTIINANVFKDLDFKVSESGDNFSSGEKQLLCMARAILKHSKILLMDEATASVDHATDELISHTIREAFAESTVLTIAHRLSTVISYDRVMLLDEGRIIEFDRPGTLLDDPASKFHALCKATGKGEFGMLRNLARR
ncbi:multidrug resistance-associated ABC transporter [Mycena epipterygia]|nr:multidrug resistance-associated ABC transporter [Mycena epipterygia]